MTAEHEGQAGSGGKAGSLLLAGLLGLAAGVVAGLLLAPKSGKELRGELGERVEELKGRASELQAKLGEKLDEMKRQASAQRPEATKPGPQAGGTD